MNVFRIAKAGVLMGMFLLMLHSTVAEAQAASFSMSPESAQFSRDCVTSVNVLLDTEGVDVIAADMFLYYNTEEVELVDQDPTQEGVQIALGGVFPAYARNTVDLKGGIIRTTAFGGEKAFSGTGVYATIVFRGKRRATAASFTFDYVSGSSTDSNVVDLSGNDVLTGVKNSAYTLLSDSCQADIRPPVVTVNSPVDGAVDVPVYSNISFSITDDRSGVDIDHIAIQIHAVSYDRNSPGVMFSGDPLNYDFVIDPVFNFPSNTEIAVVIQAQDLEGNLMPVKAFHFNSADVEAPYVTDLTPEDEARAVPLDSNVSFRLRDNDLGVDLRTVEIVVDGVRYLPTSPEVSSSGVPRNYLFEIDPVNDFDSLKEISVIVDATDLGGNEMESQSFSFNQSAVSVCGNLVVEADEQCEPPGTLACNSSCRLTEKSDHLIILLAALLLFGGGGLYLGRRVSVKREKARRKK